MKQVALFTYRVAEVEFISHDPVTDCVVLKVRSMEGRVIDVVARPGDVVDVYTTLNVQPHAKEDWRL